MPLKRSSLRTIRKSNKKRGRAASSFALLNVNNRNNKCIEKSKKKTYSGKKKRRLDDTRLIEAKSIPSGQSQLHIEPNNLSDGEDWSEYESSFINDNSEEDDSEPICRKRKNNGVHRPLDELGEHDKFSNISGSQIENDFEHHHDENIDDREDSNLLPLAGNDFDIEAALMDNVDVGRDVLEDHPSFSPTKNDTSDVDESDSNTNSNIESSESGGQFVEISDRNTQPGGCNEDVLATAVKLQNELVAKKKNRIRNLRLDVRPRDNHASGICGELDCRDQWMSDVSCLMKQNSEFLTSDEARMVHTAERKSGTTMYRKLPISHRNCADMKQIHKVIYETKQRHGYGNAVYSQFLTTIGQYARMCVAMEGDKEKREEKLDDLCEPGNLYSLATHFFFIELFIKFFNGRSKISATALTKCIHLLKFVEYATNFYSSSEDQQPMKKLFLVRDYLRSSRSAFKKETRETARQKKKIRSNLEECLILQPKHFFLCRSTAMKKLSNIMSTIRRIKGDRSKKEATLRIKKDSGTLSKWCLNFLSLLMICCGGQRPQVLVQLQRPNKTELRKLASISAKPKYIELSTIREKTTRALDMAFVPCPAELETSISFHVQEILPVLDIIRNLHTTASEAEKQYASTCLVLHSRTGLRLCTQQVTRSFQTFVAGICPELKSITTMGVRASFATMMLHGFRKKKLFVGESESTFLEYLAKAMNTSQEQLVTTYASSLDKDYSEIARQISQGMMEMMDTNLLYTCDDEVSGLERSEWNSGVDGEFSGKEDEAFCKMW